MSDTIDNLINMFNFRCIVHKIMPEMLIAADIVTRFGFALLNAFDPNNIERRNV